MEPGIARGGGSGEIKNPGRYSPTAIGNTTKAWTARFLSVNVATDGGINLDNGANSNLQIAGTGLMGGGTLTLTGNGTPAWGGVPDRGVGGAGTCAINASSTGFTGKLSVGPGVVLNIGAPNLLNGVTVEMAGGWLYSDGTANIFAGNPINLKGGTVATTCTSPCSPGGAFMVLGDATFRPYTYGGRDLSLTYTSLMFGDAVPHTVTMAAGGPEGNQRLTFTTLTMTTSGTLNVSSANAPLTCTTANIPKGSTLTLTGAGNITITGKGTTGGIIASGGYTGTLTVGGTAITPAMMPYTF